MGDRTELVESLLPSSVDASERDHTYEELDAGALFVLKSKGPNFIYMVNVIKFSFPSKY